MHVFLETDRLVLRRFTEADVDNLVELDSDPEVMRYLTGGRPTPREDIENEVLPSWLGYYDRYEGFGFWAAIEKSTGDFLGWFHFRPPKKDSRPGELELGYRLRRSAWGKGYATEGSRALVRKGFTELGVLRVAAFTMAVNAASRRVMEKSGLAFVRTFHQDWPDPIPGTEEGEVEYAVDRADWESEPTAEESRRDQDRENGSGTGTPRAGREAPVPGTSWAGPCPATPPASAAMPDDVALPPAESLAEAQRLLDAGHAFHAHEVLEGTWKAAPDSERELWRGLAQLAVGLTHIRRGNAVGAVQLAAACGRSHRRLCRGSAVRVDAARLAAWARDSGRTGGAGWPGGPGAGGSDDPAARLSRRRRNSLARKDEAGLLR